MRILVSIILLFTAINHANSQVYVNNIYLDKKPVFDTTDTFLKPVFKILNSIHINTRDYYIEDELLFDTEERIYEEDLYETERNLRRTGLFTDVRVQIDSVSEYYYDVYVVTQDKWNLMPRVLFGTGGEVTNYGVSLTDYNLLGTGTYLTITGLNRGENNIGWQGEVELNQRRLFRSELSLNSRLLSNKYRTEQELTLQKPFRTLDTKYSFGGRYRNYFGSDFLYDGFNDFELLRFHENRFQGWFSRAWRKESRVFISGYVSVEDVNRGKPEYRRAFDNSGRVLLMFSSTTDDFIRTSKLNQWQVEDMPVGGYGSATLGKVFPMGNGREGDALYYLAGQGERSYYDENVYLYGQLTGASGFLQTQGKYTYEEFLGLGFLHLADNMILAARVKQQTVWNWEALRQLVLDNDAGLRGYPANDLQGDNRIIGNLEFRIFPDIEFWVFKFGAAAFVDVGTVWDQDTDISKTRWRQSAGIGLRYQNMVATGPNSIFRIDFAYNFDKKRFGGIIFTTDQMFSIFGSHLYKIPQLFGLEFEE